MSQLLKALMPLALFLGLVVFFALGLTRDPSELPSELMDHPLPEFTATTLDGDPITEADLVGEVALVNVFGSWCVACLAEHPLFMELAENSEFNMIGLNWRDTREKARAWLNRHGNPYDQIVFLEDSRLIIDLGVTGAPETFVIDAQGRIRYKHTGIVTEDDWADLFVPLLESLILNPPSRAVNAPL